MADVIRETKAAWSKVIADKTPLPCTSLREFDSNGELVSLRTFETISETEKELGHQELLERETSPTSSCNPNATSTPIVPDSNAVFGCTESPISEVPATCEGTTSASMASTPVRPLSSRKQICQNDVEDDDVQIDFSEANEEVCSSTQLTSTLAQAIRRALGEHQDIVDFDVLHSKLKSLQRAPTANEKKHYENLLLYLQQKVLQQRSQIIQEKKQYEQDFYIRNSSLPMDSNYTELTRKLKYIKKLLRKWNL